MLVKEELDDDLPSIRGPLRHVGSAVVVPHHPVVALPKVERDRPAIVVMRVPAGGGPHERTT